MTTANNLKIRRLGVQDQPACVSLALDRGWGAEEDKWTFLLEVGTGYGLVEPDGELVGAVVLTLLGERSANIGMMLIASRCQRRGLGRRLMRHAIAQAGDRVLSLYATPNGQPLYRQLGFQVVDALTTHRGRFIPDTDAPVRSQVALDTDLADICRLDAQVYDADRSAMLRAFLGFADQVRVLREAGRLTGFAGRWRNGDTMMIGPVVAADPLDARALIHDLATPVDLLVRLDLEHRHADLRDWAERHGVVGGFETVAMVHNRATIPGDRDRLFNPVMVALG